MGSQVGRVLERSCASACQRALLALAFVSASAFATSAGATPVDYRIVTGAERGTSIAIGRDLAKIVAPDADVSLGVLASRGSVDNLTRLRYEPNVKLAIVQSDVYRAFTDYASSGNKDAGRLVGPLRVVMPLYDEEVHFLVRADSPLRYVHEIRDRKLAVDRVQSGTALTAATIYRLMFGEPIAEANAVFTPPDEALLQLTIERSIDVVVIVAGQPVKLLADMKPEAKQLVRLLKVDPDHATTRAARRTYFPSVIDKRAYPSWLDESIPAFAVKSLLVTYDYSMRQTSEHMAALALSICRHLDTLRAEGHPKWRDVDLELPDLGPGWSYYAATEKVLRGCRDSPARPASRKSP